MITDHKGYKIEENSFTDLLTGHRVALEKTQQEIADMMKVSRITYLAWENGQWLPDHMRRRRLCMVLRIPPDEYDRAYRLAKTMQIAARRAR